MQGGEYKATVSWDVPPYSLTLSPDPESKSSTVTLQTNTPYPGKRDLGNNVMDFTVIF
jgi:hypothetical protein